jgi:pimeloyl-ACP methyl ester carboxylesterase
MSYILSKDAALYYEEYGSGETLILLPGLLGTIESHWRRFIPEFARHFHAVVVDLRGHGKTNNPSGTLSLTAFVNDLHTLCDSLQIEQAHICGYSLGGYIGLAYGVQHRGKVSALIMHGTKFFWTSDAVRSTVEDFDSETIMQKVPTWGESLQRDHEPGNGKDGWEDLLLASRDFIESMPKDGLTPGSVSHADFPILVSIGDSDEMVPRDEAERLVASLPDATLHIFENTKHPMQSVQKNPFVETALSFFQGMKTRPSKSQSLERGT